MFLSLFGLDRLHKQQCHIN